MLYQEITGKSTYKLKAGNGYLQGIVVNNAGTSWTIQIFDSSGATSSVPVIAGATAFTVPAAGTTLPYDCHFTNGLTIVTAGTTAGSITVSWY